MRLRLLSAFMLLMTAAAPGVAQAPPAPPGLLKVGDPAPPLQIAEWIKGKPVTLGGQDNKQVYIVEFWATWCPPCIQSIPHLTELQKKHQDKLTIISVSDENSALVKSFVDRQGDKMDYTIAIDDKMKTSAGYMMASGQANIPTAYIVTPDFRIAWIGHPLFGLDEVLDQVLTGTFDMTKAVAAAAEAAAEAAADDKFFETRHTELLSAVQSSKWDEALKIAREVADPSYPCSKGLKVDILDNVAWLILTDTQPQTKQHHKDALYLAKTALELSEGKNGSVLDTYGLALFENGEAQQAIDFARKALEMSYDMGFRIEVQQRIMRYQQSLKSP